MKQIVEIMRVGSVLYSYLRILLHSWSSKLFNAVTGFPQDKQLREWIENRREKVLSSNWPKGSHSRQVML